MAAPLPPNEAERLQALHAYGLMDTPAEPFFDEIAALAGYVFQAPIALVGLLDEDRQWFKTRIGLGLRETPREHAFCAYTILDPEGMIVPDALADPRFASNPLVQGSPGIRFYAGAPLITREGHALGALCVLDTKPRPQVDPEQRQVIHTLGRHLMAQIEVRYSSAFLAKALEERAQAEAEQRSRMLEHEVELNRLNELKDRFLAMLAHELRNPLVPILNAIELLRSPDPDDALDILERQVRHLARLVDDLLDLSRFMHGKITLKKIKLELGETLRATLRSARPTLSKGGQRLVEEWPREALWINADPMRIDQIVSNLLINAAKFTENGKQIHLSLRREERQAVLRLRDEGIGIPPEMQERIFEPFVQIEDAQKHGGLGLGLPLVRQLVRMHNGSVEVQSEGAGRGTEFIIRLPLTDPPHPKASRAAVKESRPESALHPQPTTPVLAPANRRVLIVEDNPDIGVTLGRLIERWGHEAALVTSGTDALEKALEFRPEIALIDIGLPKMDGHSVAECFCSTPGLDGMRLIAMSGFGEEAERARARQAGFHAFLLKPVEPSVLRELLENS